MDYELVILYINYQNSCERMNSLFRDPSDSYRLKSRSEPHGTFITSRERLLKLSRPQQCRSAPHIAYSIISRGEDVNHAIDGPTNFPKSEPAATLSNALYWQPSEVTLLASWTCLTAKFGSSFSICEDEDANFLVHVQNLGILLISCR